MDENIPAVKVLDAVPADDSCRKIKWRKTWPHKTFSMGGKECEEETIGAVVNSTGKCVSDQKEELTTIYLVALSIFTLFSSKNEYYVYVHVITIEPCSRQR